MENVNRNAIGFPYRYGEEISLRRQVQQQFNALCSSNHSIEIEVPLVETLDTVVGNNAQPLRETHLNRVFHGLTFTETQSFASAVRYEASGPIAAIAANCPFKDNLDLRFHYMQEMVRLENSQDLSPTRHRAFFQMGHEFFTVDPQKNIENFSHSISVLIKFLQTLGLKAQVRLSHVLVTRHGLLSPEIDPLVRRRLIPLFEHEPQAKIEPLLRSLNFPQHLYTLLIGILEHRNVSLKQGLDFLLSRQEFYPAAQELKYLMAYLNQLGLSESCIRFDAGIHRSLGFYSGLVLQADTEFVREVAGGGDFSSVMQIYDSNSQIKSCGFAIGYERIAASLNKIKRGIYYD
jgi:histidyl-tRNA synthetase